VNCDLRTELTVNSPPIPIGRALLVVNLVILARFPRGICYVDRLSGYCRDGIHMPEDREMAAWLCIRSLVSDPGRVRVFDGGDDGGRLQKWLYPWMTPSKKLRTGAGAPLPRLHN
jgi:hypothetical protein